MSHRSFTGIPTCLRIGAAECPYCLDTSYEFNDVVTLLSFVSLPLRRFHTSFSAVVSAINAAAVAIIVVPAAPAMPAAPSMVEVLTLLRHQGQKHAATCMCSTR